MFVFFPNKCYSSEGQTLKTMYQGFHKNKTKSFPLKCFMKSPTNLGRLKDKPKIIIYIFLEFWTTTAVLIIYLLIFEEKNRQSEPSKCVYLTKRLFTYSNYWTIKVKFAEQKLESKHNSLYELSPHTNTSP